MSKTLSNILTVFKVLGIIAKVVFILCIVGGAGCLLGLFMLPLASTPFVADALAKAEIGLESSYFACIAGAVVCAGEAVFAFLAEKYCQSVQKEGTPFSIDGSKQCLRLGIASLIIAVATETALGIASGIVLLFSESAAIEADIGGGISLTMGLFLLFLSMIFKYGAELRSSAAEKAEQEKAQDTHGETL